MGPLLKSGQQGGVSELQSRDRGTGGSEDRERQRRDSSSPAPPVISVDAACPSRVQPWILPLPTAALFLCKFLSTASQESLSYSLSHWSVDNSE